MRRTPSKYAIVRAQRILQSADILGRALLDAANSAGLLARAQEEERPKHVAAQIADKVNRLEQLTAADSGRAVVDPDPEAVLDPLQIGLGIDGRCGGQGAGHLAVSLPEDHRILHAVLEIGKREKLQIDVQQWRPIEADQQTGLADMLAGKRRQQAPAAFGDRDPLSAYRALVFWIDADDEIEIRILIHPRQPRPTRGNVGDPWVLRKLAYDAIGGLMVNFGHAPF